MSSPDAVSATDISSARSPASRETTPICRKPRRWRGIERVRIAITPKRSARAIAVRMPHSAMPSTGLSVASRHTARPGSE